MKILSVSDYVDPSLYDQFDTEQAHGVDLILSCGDLPPEYLSQLNRTFNVPLYYVRGNHDIRYTPTLPDGCIDLDARLIQFQGLHILGFSGSRWYNGGPQQFTEGQMRKTIRSLRLKLWWNGSPDIIIAHAPPRHIHDAEDLCHRGFKSFRWLIDHYSPAYFLHGHIHKNFTDPSQRITRVNQTRVVNSYGYTLLDMDPEKLRKSVKKIGRNRSERPVKSFNEDQLKEEAFSHGDRETRVVPVRQIVGSVGRYNDFDSKFRPKQHVPPDRLKSIMKAMRKGKPLPPVKLYQIKDEYYVLDGNHRISAAKAFGHSDINAHVVEFVPSKNTLENILYREKSEFMHQTGLSGPIELTEVGQYAFLLRQISSHQALLEQEKTGPVSMAEAASDWLETIYGPLVAIIQKGGLIESFPDRTLADLYAYVSFHQWEKGRTRKYGIGIDRLIPNNMEDFRKKMSKIKSMEYPEMQREITAFILIDVKAKHESRIMEKLFALKEVRELHSVHGNVDILLKFALTRDILTSDSEIISQFVHEKVRTLHGVTSTQTLIPGSSKVKTK